MADEQPTNPATSAVVGAMGAVRTAVERVGLTLQRMESRQSPGLRRVTPAGSACPSGEGQPASHERLRVIEWVITAGAAGAFSLMAGQTVLATVQFAAAGTLVVPLPITIDRGLTVTTAGTAASIVDSFLTLYTE